MALHAIQIQADFVSIQEALLERHYRRKHGATAYYGQKR
jgi:hypothetical protein